MKCSAFFLRRLARNERGLAFIEFAFAAPVLLLLILGGLELANYALSHLRVNQIAMTVADNAGRVTTGIDEANVYEVFAGAEVIGMPIDFGANGRIVLSSLQPNGMAGSDAGQMINWQRCWGDLDVPSAYGVEGDGRDDNSMETGMGATGNEITSAAGTAVMVVEVSYTYQPLIDTGYMIIDETIYHESAFNVRGRQNNDITNSSDLNLLDCGSEASGGGSGGGSSGGSSSGGTTSSTTTTSGGTSSTTSSGGTSSTTTSGGTSASSSGGSSGSNGGGSSGSNGGGSSGSNGGGSSSRGGGNGGGGNGGGGWGGGNSSGWGGGTSGRGGR